MSVDDDLGRPGPGWVRAGGRYARYLGDWFSAGAWGAEGEGTLFPTPSQLERLSSVDETGLADGVLTVPVSAVDRVIYVRPQVSYRGGRFEIYGLADADGGALTGWVEQSFPGAAASVRYAGDDWDWAASLPGFVRYGEYDGLRGAGVWNDEVPLTELSDYEEEVTHDRRPGAS